MSFAKGLVSPTRSGTPPAGTLDSARILDDLAARAREASARGEGFVFHEAGEPEAALAGAARRIEALYRAPYLAHAAMEPMNCVIRLGADGCEVWNGEQMQTGDQFALVVFHSDAQVLMPLTVIDDDSLALAKSKIDAMQAWGTTDLAGGLRGEHAGAMHRRRIQTRQGQGHERMGRPRPTLHV